MVAVKIICQEGKRILPKMLTTRFWFGKPWEMHAAVRNLMSLLSSSLVPRCRCVSFTSEKFKKICVLMKTLPKFLCAFIKTISYAGCDKALQESHANCIGMLLNEWLSDGWHSAEVVVDIRGLESSCYYVMELSVSLWMSYLPHAICK